MRLYHGSDLRIKTVNLAHCMKYRDFGQGFYTTRIEEHALRWAQRIAQRSNTQPVVTAFDFWEGVFEDKDFRTLRFAAPSSEWVEFVIKNRDHKETLLHDFDIVEGPIANDWVTTRIGLYQRNKITMEDLLCELTYREATHQVCFCTTLSLQALEVVEEETSWNAEVIADAVYDALVGELGMDKMEAQQRFYLSDTFGKLTDTTTGLHAKPWTETYALLKKELGI